MTYSDGKRMTENGYTATRVTFGNVNIDKV